MNVLGWLIENREEKMNMLNVNGNDTETLSKLVKKVVECEVKQCDTF